MKFLCAIIAYVAIAAVLGWGILLAVKGSFWILALGILGYLIALAKFGCLPTKSH